MRRLQSCTLAILSGSFATLAAAAPSDTLAFHRDAQRTGWNNAQAELTRANVAADSFGLIWESPPLGETEDAPALLYASPLYVERVRVTAGTHAGRAFAVVFAATNQGVVYAINAFQDGAVPAGTILWRTPLGSACKLEPKPLDGVPTGVLATPVIDLERQRLYVTSCEQQRRWQAYALDLGSGALLPGWPVQLDEATLNRPDINRNAAPVGHPAPPPRRFDFRVQRGALNLSPDGARLYVTFGETSTGWLVSVDTTQARIDSAFATVAKPHRSNGGIWGAGGAAVDARGSVYVVTGTGFNGFIDQAHDWVQSVLMLTDGKDGLTLRGTYTPFNYCATATTDIDLGSGGVTLLPDLQLAATATPHLMAVGGKQGNVYLIDRARMPGRLDRRPPCSSDASTDASLLPPGNQPQFGTRGPLNVFGPYSESHAALDTARARSVPAYFRDGAGTHYLFVTGSTRQAADSPVSVPPSLARLQVVTAPATSAHLRVAQLEHTLVFENPGSPVITSNAAVEAIVWVLDQNARRSALLAGESAPRPVLYALDALTFEPLWRSAPGELRTSGKYNEPVFARGTVFVGTDRIQAFGKGASIRVLATAPAAAPGPQKAVTGDAPGDSSATDTTATGKSAVAVPQTIDAAAIYRQRCAVCHENPEGSVPPRTLIASRSHAHIVDVLSRGSMRPMTAGLSTAEIDALAQYLR